MQNSYIIITNGATGSGKTDLISKVITNYKLSNNYTKILIDDLIESNKKYKDDILDIVSKECCSSDQLCDKLRDKLNNPPEELLQAFSKAYFKTRRNETQCVGENDAKITCEKKIDDCMENALKSGKNIIFETQILYNIPWLIKLINTNRGSYIYDIYFSVTILGVNDLVYRNKSRAIVSMQKFINDPDKIQATRLPSVDIKTFEEINNKIANNLIPLIKNPLNYEITVCVFDNTSREIVILYDSQKPYANKEDIINNILNILGIPKYGGSELYNKYTSVLSLLAIIFFM